VEDFFRKSPHHQTAASTAALRWVLGELQGKVSVGEELDEGKGSGRVRVPETGDRKRTEEE
jgi:hypothetical protein